MITESVSAPATKPRRLWQCGSLILSLVLVACDGGSGAGGSVRNDSNGAGGEPFPPINLNGSATGQVFLSGRSEYLDLSTGETVPLSGDIAMPTMDGRTIVELYENYRFYPDAGCFDSAVSHDRIVFRDAFSGLVLDSFEIAEDVHGPLRVSPDGLSIAVVWSKGGTCFDEDTALTILSRNGDELIRGNEAINSFDWLPDSRLVIARDSLIRVQTSGEFNFNTIADMSSVAGVPGRLNVSPDGTRVLFEMITGGSSFLDTIRYREATVWAVDIDGSNLRQIATTSREDDPTTDIDDPQVNTPVWSPDSGNFLVTEDFTSGGLILVGDASVVIDFIPVINGGLTYIAPADTPPLRLPPESYSSTGLRPVLKKSLDGAISATGLNPFSTNAWVQDLARAPVVSGALPAWNGQVNRGLSGKVYLMGEDDDDRPILQSVDLRSGSTTIETVFADDDINQRNQLVAISTGATRTAHHIYKSLNSQALRVYDSAGAQLYAYDLITNNYHYPPETALRFSPVNENVVAWIYDDDDFGTGAIAMDVSTGAFIARWTNRDYNAITFTNDGHLLVFDEGQVFQSLLSDEGYGALRQIFEIADVITQPDINPINNDIAFVASGQVFVVGIDGQNLRRLVAPSDEPITNPSWSRDGRFLSVRKDYDGFVVAADAQHARLYDDHRSVGAFEIGEGAAVRTPLGFARFEWR